MPCPVLIYDYALGEKSCGRPTVSGSNYCWRHAPETAAERQKAAAKSARTRRRNRSFLPRLRAAILRWMGRGE